MPSAVIRTIGEPIEVKRAPETGYQAQFSGPYAVVAGLLGGAASAPGSPTTADALAATRRRRALMATSTSSPTPRCDEIFPNQFPAVVTVRTDDGRELDRGGAGQSRRPAASR